MLIWSANLIIFGLTEVKNGIYLYFFVRFWGTVKNMHYKGNHNSLLEKLFLIDIQNIFVVSENSCTFVTGKTNIKLCLLPLNINRR
jgi:hypothetical protein